MSMTLDFYQSPPHNLSPLPFRNSQHAINFKFLHLNKPHKNAQSLSLPQKHPHPSSHSKQIHQSNPQQKQIQQMHEFQKTIHQDQTPPQLQQQQQFFPSIRPRVKDPYKMQQLYMINKKQRKRNSMLETKLKLYKQILQTQQKTKKSKEKYLRDRGQRYDRIKNASFLELNQKLQHQNRFNVMSITSLDKLGLEFRSNSLYFRTLEELDQTIHKVNKVGLAQELHASTIPEPRTQRNRKAGGQGISRLNKYNYRYYEDENEQKRDTYEGFTIGSMEESYKRKRLQELSKERQKINEMVKMYKEYEENEAVYKKISLKS